MKVHLSLQKKAENRNTKINKKVSALGASLVAPR